MPMPNKPSQIAKAPRVWAPHGYIRENLNQDPKSLHICLPDNKRHLAKTRVLQTMAHLRLARAILTWLNPVSEFRAFACGPTM